jgi:hypothetical protein
MLADYRRPFWRMAWQATSAARSKRCLASVSLPYHVIEFSCEAVRGQQNASFYSARFYSVRARETIDVSA